MPTIHDSWHHRDIQAETLRNRILRAMSVTNRLTVSQRLADLPSATPAVRHHRIAWEASLVVTR